MNPFLRFVTTLGHIGFFSVRVAHSSTFRPLDWNLIVYHMYKIGIETLPVLVAVCAFVGTNIALVGYHIFKSFGGQEFLGAYVGLTCIREMAPILTGAMLAAKPGTDIAATIATMRVKEQIDALEVMAVDPYWYLILPRFIAFILVTPFLIIFANFSSIMAGYCVAVYQLHLNAGNFMNDLISFVDVSDLRNGMLKGVLFSIVSCLLATYFGFHSKAGPKGVSQAINLSVVTIASFIVIFNFFLTAAIYG